MRFAFTWERAPRINRWSWLPGARQVALPCGLYRWLDGEHNLLTIEVVEHHLYIYWGYGQWHWVWGGFSA